MQVFGIGNVTDCNSSWIHLNDEDLGEHRVKATVELLTQVYTTATDNYALYRRMYELLKAEADKRVAEVKRRYQYISEEDIKNSNSIFKEIDMKLHNERCNEAYNKVYGFRDAVSWVNDQIWDSYKYQTRAKNALNAINK